MYLKLFYNNNYKCFDWLQMLHKFYIHLYHNLFTSMNTRLQQFLTLENLSPARLADILGIQRSGMSHLLSGRNKPGYDFILKLCTKFPDLNANWFITGKGKPYLERNTPAIPSSVVSGPSGQFENAEQLKENTFSNLFDPILGPEEENEEFEFSGISGKAMDLTGDTIDNQQNTSENTAQYPRENQINGENKARGHKNRRVKRVIIFYSDGSFDELFPAR